MCSRPTLVRALCLVASVGAAALWAGCERGAQPQPRAASPQPSETTEPTPPAADPLVADATKFADEACACEDPACASEVSAAFNAWAADRSETTAEPDMGANVAAQVARMGACLERFRAPLPLQGKPCTDSGECAEGLTCVRYYGIAGPRGPEFTSCEIPCAKARCPDGQRCVTISDGPGRVCRPDSGEAVSPPRKPSK